MFRPLTAARRRSSALATRLAASGATWTAAVTSLLTGAALSCLIWTTARFQAPTAGPGAGRRGLRKSERGDVPGWVMITMMTAIVVIALIAVFRDAVLDAVTNAFNSITGKS